MAILKTVLVCTTVLWINAEAYIVRVLVLELTREEEGLLFLPPEIHRHPLYLETDRRSMAMHWCDLCQQRISATSPATTCRVATSDNDSDNGSDNGNSNAKSAGGWCYRCALCDFDICIPCSRRNDAATVGENVLRGDRGVRAETSLTTTEYVKRSIAVAGRSEWPWLMASFVLLAISSLSKLFLPHFQGKIIDKVIPIPYHPGGGSDGDDDDDGNGEHGGTYYDKKGFLHFIFIYVLVMLAQGAVSTLYSAIFTLVSRRLKFTIRNALLEKILAQDVAYFDGTESGRLISRLTNDLDMMMAPIQSSLSNLLSNCLILIGGMVMCFFKSYRLSMLAFVTIGPISYLWEQYAQWSKKLAREMLSYWAQGNSIAAQALSHIRTVKAFGCEDVVLQKYSETNKMALDCGIKDAWGNGLTSALTGYLDLGTGILILYFGGLLVYRGEMSVGDLVTYQLFWNMMNNAYQNLQGLVTSFTRSAAGAEKVFSLWDSDPDIDPQKGSNVREDEVSGHLELKNVSFYYQMRPDHLVLENFDLDIPPGKTLALVGRSGGGKSTIINLLLRFYDPRQGKLLLDGKPYDSMKVHQLRRLFGVVTQDTELFALTIEENIAYGLDKDDYTFEEVVEAAKKAYAHDFICDMKDGYRTRIGERGSRISGGQRQRLAIARVFLRKPKIILLDEATSALDENSQEAVQKALAVLIKESQSTVVMVAHRLSTVINADSICVIDKGRVLEKGSHEELASKPGGIYASMVSKQLSKKGDLLDQEEENLEGDNAVPKSSASKGKTKRIAVADTIDDLLAD
jgi:ABC-type multidrug transport system fused ATPase/permease subunit